MSEKTNVFTILNSLNDKKQYYGSNNEVMKEYNAWSINRGMSLFPETIFYSNDMNISQNLTEKMQYDYYYYSVRQGKRFSKWPKKLDKSDDFTLIKQFYKYNDQRALEALRILTKKDIETIRTMTEKGGVNNDTGKSRGDRTK